MAKSLFLVASLGLLLLVLPLSLAVSEPKKASESQKHDTRPIDLVGGYEPIQNDAISSPYIQSLGEYAVNEHNRQAKSNLKFQKVTSGFFQIVAGTNYKLHLTAINGAISSTYETIVYKDLKDISHLITFFSISN